MQFNLIEKWKEIHCLGPRYNLRKYVALIPNYIIKAENYMIKPSIQIIDLRLKVKLWSGKVLAPTPPDELVF